MRKLMVGTSGILVLVMAISIAACNTAQPDPLAIPDAGTSAPTVTEAEVSDGAPDDPETTFGSPEPVPETETPEPPVVPIESPPPGSFVVLAEEVQPLVDNVIPTLDRPSGPAFADGAGGLVFQPPWGVDDAIFYLGPDGGEPEPLLDVADGRLLTLWGATNEEGTPRLLAVVVDGDGTADEQETLLWWDRLDKVTWIGQVGDASTQVLSVDHGTNRFVIDRASPEGSSFVFLDGTGNEVDLTSNPKPLCRGSSQCRRLPSLAPDGSNLAYFDPAIRKVVVIELDSGSEVLAIEVPSTSEITSLDLSSDHLIINHEVAGDAQAAFSAALDGEPALRQLSVPGNAYLGVMGTR